MLDEDKPYLCVRNGWMVHISPRNAEGWRGLGMWMAALLVLTAIFVALVGTEPDGMTGIAITIGFLLVLGGGCWAMIRWMMARSEIVDAGKLDEFRRQQKRDKTR